VGDAGKAVVQGATNAAKTAAGAQLAPTVAILEVATGKPVSEAAGDVAAAQGKALQAAGEVASDATEKAENVKVTVAAAIAGDPGKTVMQVTVGPNRYAME